MSAYMGLQFGLQFAGSHCKRKFRYLTKIPDVSALGLTTLPPMRSSRPALQFQEMQARHIVEDIFYPGRPVWTPMRLTLYDLKRNEHPVFKWIKEIYDPLKGTHKPVADGDFVKTIDLELYNGCGDKVETWVYQDAWISQVDFGELDMSNIEITTCDMTIRYSRAFITSDVKAATSNSRD